MNKKYKLITMNINGDNDGHLIACQYKSNCPFDVKRVFWIFDTKAGIMRGAHANRNSEFLLIAINGSCKVKVDDGQREEIFDLNNPYTGLYLNKMIWKEMYNFSHNAILLVLTNTLYDEKEYIRDYSTWKKEIVNV
mgnify:FL=1